MLKKYSQTSKNLARESRAKKILSYLKGQYPNPKTELLYETPIQFLVAVMLSAQCTDKVVNRVTRSLFQTYKNPKHFAQAKVKVFERAISSIPFFRNKTKAILRSAKDIVLLHKGKVPKTEPALVALYGVGYKTAHVVLGELYGVYDGIPTDTHVKRFARRFDLTDNTDLKKISKDLEALVPKRDWKYMNNGLVLYGRNVCKAHKHDCKNHPLTKIWPKANDRWPKAK